MESTAMEAMSEEERAAIQKVAELHDTAAGGGPLIATLAKVPVLLDTDIGSDIDDAVALAYLLKQPQCDLLGITTVSGEPEKRASLADAVCQAAGRSGIPVHVGTGKPLLVAQRQPEASQFEALKASYLHRLFEPNHTAVEFLRRTIRARPNEITLLTIGPLTNIALLFATDPEIPAILKQLVMMGGRYFPSSPDGANGEWNILCDPHAAAIVFEAPVPKLIAVGLDVTEQCTMSAEECRERFIKAGGPLLSVAAMAEVWFRHTQQITFHDPLAAALIFEPQLCGLLSTRIDVELCQPGKLGDTLLREDSTLSGHQVARGVDPQAFFDHYFSIVGMGNTETA